MDASQAIAFVEKIIGSELCTGAGEDESAQYYISPIPRAFLEGAIGTHHVPDSLLPHRTTTATLAEVGIFFQDVGETLQQEAERRATRLRGDNT